MALAAALVAGATLTGCGRGADSGASSNATAPGQPGTGNAVEARIPQAPDGPPGGPSGVAGSAPHTGGSGADVIPGTSGRGTAEPGGRSTTAQQPGSGTTGGLGTSMGNTAAMPQQGSAASEGSTNRTTDGAVGRR